MATLSFVSSTETSITVRLSGLDSSYTGDRIYEWYLDGDLAGETESTGSKTSVTYTFTNLDPDTEYYIGCDVTYWTSNGAGDEVVASFDIEDPVSTEAEEVPDFQYRVMSYDHSSIRIRASNLVSGCTVKYWIVDEATEAYVVDG